MRWTYLSLASTLSFPGASASFFEKKRTGEHTELGRALLSSDMRHAASVEFEKHNQTTPNPIVRFLLQPRQNEGRCGAEFGGTRCTDNQCCSAYGYCGTAYEHCAALVGCQPQYGRCGEAPVEPTTTSTTSTPTPTPTSMPTPTTTTTLTSTNISPTSTTSTSTSVQPPLPSGTLISTNGQCGNSTICTGSAFGNCCSEWYYCGNSLDYCGTGCHSAFGQCNGSPPISSSSSTSTRTTVPTTSTTSTSLTVTTTSATFTTSTTSTTTTTLAPTTTSTTRTTTSTTSTSTQRPLPTNISTDGQCGSNGKTCTGYAGGRCCSSYGWCGSQDEFCRLSWGCQPQFGECGTLSKFSRST